MSQRVPREWMTQYNVEIRNTDEVPRYDCRSQSRVEKANHATRNATEVDDGGADLAKPDVSDEGEKATNQPEIRTAFNKL